MKKIRTLVCGSTFGQFYLEAIKQLPEQFELVGLLAKGSERSRQCAELYATPLYKELEELPDDIDLACVVLRTGVLGGEGTDLSLALLEKGIHVIQEQPVHHKDIAVCIKTARKRGVQFHVGNLYVHLPTVQRFIHSARVLLEHREALYLDAAFASQVSYPFVHILSQVLPRLRPWQTDSISRNEGPFHVATGTIGGVPAILRVHHEVNPEDPDNYLHLLHQITIGTDAGNVSLTDTHGPVVWRPRLHVPLHLKLAELAQSNNEHLEEKSTVYLGKDSPASYETIFTKLWPQAIARELLMMRQRMLYEETGAVDSIAQQILSCARQWHEMTSALGYPVLRPGSVHQPLSAEHLLAAAAQVDEMEVSRSSGVTNQIETASVVTEAGRAVHELFAAVDAESVRTFVERLDQSVMCAMIHTLQSFGLLIGTERTYSMADIKQVAATQHAPIIERWLRLLVARGVIDRCGDGYMGTHRISDAMLQNRWKGVREVWDGKLGPSLVIDYLLENAERLPHLIKGEDQAAWLLFPQGSMVYADALYRDTVIARYLNELIAETVVRIGATRQHIASSDMKKPLSIVEIGAGTGATTQAVAAKWGECTSWRCDYLFTDVSQFFLTTARDRFRHCSWMRFGIVDMEKNIVEQGLEEGCADIVIAAGVVNNAHHTDDTIGRLWQILAPGGWLLVTEPTREFSEILISQAFMMNHPHDERKQTGTTFLTIDQWRRVFERVGATELVILPETDHPLAQFGQTFFAVRKGD